MEDKKPKIDIWVPVEPTTPEEQEAIDRQVDRYLATRNAPGYVDAGSHAVDNRFVIEPRCNGEKKGFLF